ncbi:MAG: DUF3524 domain-containing protein [Gammaproteobacteria bacterium]|nr:DUF3524 domain-containing protein [Gammaproteobacteria bacterium]
MLFTINILLLSAYDAQSHQHWRKALVQQFSQYNWTQLTLPARFFNWRIRGNALTWFFQEHTELARHYDLIMATSMVDLATLKGLSPNLAIIPSIVYFHENQFAYPRNIHQPIHIEPQMVTLYSGLAANRLLFNSHYNLTTYLSGIKQLLSKMPDCVPHNVISYLEQQSEVIPVPIDLPGIQIQKRYLEPLTLVWNHRWEYDKGPERLYELLVLLTQRRINFNIHIIGQQFQRCPEVFQTIQHQFCQQIISFGYQPDRNEYFNILSQSDLVLSTAVHEFQGLAVLEAVACGCIPVVPDRLCYPELFDQDYRYLSNIDNPHHETTSMCDKIEYWQHCLKSGQQLINPDLSTMTWKHLVARYQRVIQETISLS